MLSRLRLKLRCAGPGRGGMPPPPMPPPGFRGAGHPSPFGGPGGAGNMVGWTLGIACSAASRPAAMLVWLESLRVASLRVACSCARERMTSFARVPVLFLTRVLMHFVQGPGGPGGRGAPMGPPGPGNMVRRSIPVYREHAGEVLHLWAAVVPLR